MSNLTTVEMLSSIRHRQTATCGEWGIKVRCSSGDIIVTKESTAQGLGKPLPMTNLVLNSMKWQLSPLEISFTEALELIKENSVVTMVDKNGETARFNCLDETISFEEVVSSKWYVGCFYKVDFE